MWAGLWYKPLASPVSSFYVFSFVSRFFYVKTQLTIILRGFHLVWGRWIVVQLVNVDVCLLNARCQTDALFCIVLYSFVLHLSVDNMKSCHLSNMFLSVCLCGRAHKQPQFNLCCLRRRQTGINIRFMK